MWNIPYVIPSDSVGIQRSEIRLSPRLPHNFIPRNDKRGGTPTPE